MGNYSKETLRSLSLQEIEKLRGSARQWAYRSYGQRLDEELKTLLPSLRKQAKDFPELEHGNGVIPDWLEEGQDILRNVGYGKLPRPYPPDEEELAEDSRRPFSADDSSIESKFYTTSYIDSLAGEFARRAQRCSLTPDLTVFCIRVLEAALVHAQKFVSQTFEYKQEITDYLEELKSSGLSYREPPPPPKVKLKPGPKPKLKVFERAVSSAYVSHDGET